MGANIKMIPLAKKPNASIKISDVTTTWPEYLCFGPSKIDANSCVRARPKPKSKRPK